MSLQCPKCHSSCRFGVEVITTYTIDEEENIFDYSQDFYWDDDSSMYCKICGYEGTAREFRGKDEKVSS